MAYFKSCIGCISKNSECTERNAIAAAIKGLRITSVKHTCKSRIPIYQSGQKILVLTCTKDAYANADHDDYGRAEYSLNWYPAIFIDQLGSKALAFIKEGQEPIDNDEPFESKNGSGFVKVPFSRTKPSEDKELIEIVSCDHCGQIPVFGQICQGFDGRMTPKCLLPPTKAAQ